MGEREGGWELTRPALRAPSRLKLLQTVGSGTAQVTGSEFWKTIPPEHPLILANAAGIHVSPIGEHGPSSSSLISLPSSAPLILFEHAVLMTSMMLLHRMQQVADITRGEQRWAHPAELGGLFVQELRGLTFGILGVRCLPFSLSTPPLCPPNQASERAETAQR